MPAPILDRPFPMLTGMATVARRAAITPRMVRFTLAAPAFAELGVEEPGEILTLGWCDPGEELVMPERGWRFPRGRPEQHAVAGDVIGSWKHRTTPDDVDD